MYIQVEEEEEEGVVSGAAGEGVGGGGELDVSQWELGDLADQDAVSKLMHMLEGQVSQLDRKLE